MGDERVVQLLEEILAALRRSAANADPLAAVDVDAAAQMLGCSPARVWELLKDGTLERAPRHGKRTLVTRASIDKALEGTLKEKGKLLPPSRIRRRHHSAAVPASTSRPSGEADAIRKLPV